MYLIKKKLFYWKFPMAAQKYSIITYKRKRSKKCSFVARQIIILNNRSIHLPCYRQWKQAVTRKLLKSRSIRAFYS
ncbi:hypothetical protein CI610_01957 [invertebrate metagenome]|uniref:Uncharacterized protein n=1 Tax=invertebrate metagenome TaxID=1711999 RepID=A0A2H9T7A7_9ZZZZ